MIKEPKNKGHTNFNECCDLTKKVYLMNIRYQVRNLGFFLKCASQCKRKSRIYYNSCWAMGIFGMSKKVSYISMICLKLTLFGPLAQNSFVNLALYAQVIVICVGLQKYNIGTYVLINLFFCIVCIKYCNCCGFMLK